MEPGNKFFLEHGSSYPYNFFFVTLALILSKTVLAEHAISATISVCDAVNSGEF